MEKYAFKIMGPGGSENGKWIKLFSSSEEVASLRIQVRFPSLKKETLLSMSNTMMKKIYIDIDVVPTDDIDSFIDMFETAQHERELEEDNPPCKRNCFHSTRCDYTSQKLTGTIVTIPHNKCW